ncbi:hypothetical protein [Rhodococcus wratislaviensis]|uniref:Transglycosylase SLT domain-containing protein n=1 Tax=Rhodococcus wratislaviensis NBRC 100605 TaxID=1219028 RepID=X0PMG3_RHOWR|nr:hypothetical protein [Rhodococcus wratislaviensis]GAF43749.1 hypothetical protein RW1_009_01740 [Rhodococcus wratislaviensis NBRC 100605]
MNYRITTALTVMVLATAVIAGCGNNSDDDIASQPAPTSDATTQVLDPFVDDTADGAQQETVTRIIDLGNQRKASDNAIIAALVASRAEGFWRVHHSGSGGRNLFGWSQMWDDRPALDDGAVTDAIENFYAGAESPENAAKNDDPVDYAVAIQLSDHSGGRVYFEDREAYDANLPDFRTEDTVRKTYTEALPYARAAYEQLG